MGFDDFDFRVLQKVSAWKIEDGKLIVPERTRSSADNLLDEVGDRLAILAEKLGLRMALINFPGAKRGYEILSSGHSNDLDLVMSMTEEPQESQSEPAALGIDSDPNSLLVIPDQELSEGYFHGSSRPTYVNRIFDQENLYANPAATAAQGGKPKFIGQNAYSLNDPDELDRRCHLLESGEMLREYEYQAWRWYFDWDANRWRLKRMQFVSNFRRLEQVNFGKLLQCNEPCWLGQVLVAEERPLRAA